MFQREREREIHLYSIIQDNVFGSYVHTMFGTINVHSLNCLQVCIFSDIKGCWH